LNKEKTFKPIGFLIGKYRSYSGEIDEIILFVNFDGFVKSTFLDGAVKSLDQTAL
jgi:hypothetical protein